MPPKKTQKSQLKLTEQSEIRLRNLLYCVIQFEEKLDVLRMFLCSNEMFEPYSVFCRLNRSQNGFICPVDILNFFRDNGVTDVTEADCYFLIKFFDSDEDGKLHYPDFLQIVLPCTNPKIRAAAT